MESLTEQEKQQQQQIMDRRADALGDLRVIPDEILCSILEYLQPSDLARLSCVSSVMYILCNEEPLWMSLCLRMGGLLEYKGSWKRTTLFQQNLCNITETACQKGLQFYGFNSMFLYRRWYRRFTTLNAFALDNGILERKKDLSMEEFHSEYDGKKPLLLTELAETWPAKKKWTKDQLLLSYGDVAFRISQRSSKKITMKFKDYVSYMEIQHDEEPLYIFDDKFGEVAPPLLEDYSVPHLFQEDFFDVLDPDQRPPFRWLIIGPERSGASWHVDPSLTSAWNTLLSGRKRWALYPPGRVPAGVTVHVNEEDGDVNIDSPPSLLWWLDIYPHLPEDEKPIECTQSPGETIFVPSGWWHCVLNLETTIAVTQNFVNSSNFEYVCLDMAPGHRHKGICRAGLLAVQDMVLEDAKGDASFNQINYPDMTRKEKRLKVLDSGKDIYRNGSKKTVIKGLPDVCKKLQNEDFSYGIGFLSMFLEEDRDHYNCTWRPSNPIGPREMREWLHRLWVTKSTMRQLIWKGACLALNANKWSSCMMEVCASNNLPSPLYEEKLPVGTGSNPVFLVSDCVIKIYVEGGLESSILGLGSELEFYSLLHKVKSNLLNHVPDVIASGLLVHENGLYKALPWDGREVPEVIANCILEVIDCDREGSPFGIWRKKMSELKDSGIISCAKVWPYIVTKRCKGDIFAHLRDVYPRDDLLHLASFLGDQLRNLHILPLPPFQTGIETNINNISLKRTSDRLVVGSQIPAANASTNGILKATSVPPEWELVITVLNGRKKNLKDRLSQWGDPIPEILIEKVGEYIPDDLTLLLNLSEEKDGLYKVIGHPTWIHSDIMDDNIHIEPCITAYFIDESLETASCASSTVNSTLDACTVEGVRKWLPTHILDFSGLSIGDPLYDLIPIYLDIFRGDVYLLKKLLENYRIPLIRKSENVLSGRPIDNWEKFKRLSYRAMCYCILHEENILGAIFSLWKELRKAKSWEEVEEAVWGELNHYKCFE